MENFKSGQSITIVLDPERTNELLEEHGLTEGYREASHACVQYRGTAEGRPCVMLIVDVGGGKRVLVKHSLRMLEAVCEAARAASEAMELAIAMEDTQEAPKEGAN